MASESADAFFTRCPECGSVYRLTDEQIDHAAGRVVCGWCDEQFNALAYLSNTPPEQEAESAVQESQSLEFDAPQDQWDEFFMEEGPESATGAGFLPEEYEAPVWLVEGETEPAWNDDGESEGPGEMEAKSSPEESPLENDESWVSPWPTTESVPEASDGRPLVWLAACGILMVVLLLQLVHQQRDALAASPAWGNSVRSAYARLDSPVYPDWQLNDYEIRAFNAVAGDAAEPVLEVNAQVTIIGDHPVGYPMVRLTLNDVWAGPVAQGVFGPSEYLGRIEFDSETLLSPGTQLPVLIRVPDPGPDALGYKVDLCVLKRGQLLQCQLDQGPFRDNTR